jgi:hypothetical protein
MEHTEDKGEWAETAEEGIVPDELSRDGGGDGPEGRVTGSDEPATEAGVDLSAGDNADATTDGGVELPEDAEPDLKDAMGAHNRPEAG